jgi:hypothetical protein
MPASATAVVRWFGALILATAGACAMAAETVDTSSRWSALTPAQQQALAPLQRDWQNIELGRRQKWLEVAGRFPKMPPEERSRIQTRMAEWARLSPTERASARMQFQETRSLSTEQRQQRWQAYQALPDAEKRRLAQSSKPANGPTVVPVQTVEPKKPAVASRPAVPLRPAQPPLLQAKPGATTTTITTRAKPPAHHQPGMPKIAATPGFVDPATLLPTRGPQGAAVRSAASGDPAQQP